MTMMSRAAIVPVPAEADIDFARIGLAGDVNDRGNRRAALYRMRRAS